MRGDEREVRVADPLLHGRNVLPYWCCVLEPEELCEIDVSAVSAHPAVLPDLDADGTAAFLESFLETGMREDVLTACLTAYLCRLRMQWRPCGSYEADLAYYDRVEAILDAKCSALSEGRPGLLYEKIKNQLAENRTVSACLNTPDGEFPAEE